MTYQFYDNNGLITVLFDGKIPSPFMYIDARHPPPWYVEPLDGKSVPFDSLDAAKMALFLAVKHWKDLSND